MATYGFSLTRRPGGLAFIKKTLPLCGFPHFFFPQPPILRARHPP